MKKTTPRVIATGIASLLLAFSAVGAANAAVVYPREGGVWHYGASPVVYSRYFHPSKCHGVTVVGRTTIRLTGVRGGWWAATAVERKLLGNKAYYHTC